MSGLERAKEALHTHGYTCVLCKDDAMYTSARRGVAPLVAFLRSDIDFSGFSAADKVVGKATAWLYVRLGVAAVYAAVISNGALDILSAHGIHVEYDRVTAYIINRRGDGMCPFEAAVADATDAAEAVAVIRRTMAQLNIDV